MNKKRIIGASFGVLIIIVATISLISYLNRSNTELIASPTVSKITLDGKKIVKTGKLRLSIGKHTVVASFVGFNNATKSFTVASSGITKVTLYLVPNSQAGYDYLNKHRDEASKREDIGSSQFYSDSQKRIANNPIIKLLPYVGAGYDFKIDYGAQQGDSADPNAYALYITYYVPGGDQEALNWLSRQPSYDASKYQIIYTDKSTSESQVINNPNTN